MRKLAHKEKEIEHAVMEKRHQEKAPTKINKTTSLKLDEVSSIISGDSDSLDADTETDQTEYLKFIFPSTSSGATGST